jgi:Na+/H+-dicarboxylate symporter
VVFWAFKELMWWRVIGLFCGLLVGFFAEAPSAHFILRRLPWIRIASTR